ncbi:MAG: ABC transporter ATP-binding protein [Crocinitomicaceae bacterium]|nr:ABC transporter ATP-binding protein [Crocinitomicaceae bacterium]
MLVLLFTTIGLNDLRLNNIAFGYKGKGRIFEGLNLNFKQGSFVFILGENGSGKSTLLKLILGANEASSGSITYNNLPLKDHLERAKRIGYIPQSKGIDPEMSLNDMLDFIAKSHRLNGSIFQERKSQIISSLGLSGILTERSKKLSGGQQQLISISLGLIHDPEIVLLDEPFVGLDYGTRSKIIAFLKSTGKTILCVTHDIDLAQNNADKILFLEKGKPQEYGTPEEIIEQQPYFVAEVDFAPKLMDRLPEMEEVQMIYHYHRVTITCPDRKDLTDPIDRLLKQREESILQLKVYRKNLKSTLIGRYQLSFSDREEGKKNKKRQRKK